MLIGTKFTNCIKHSVGEIVLVIGKIIYRLESSNFFHSIDVLFSSFH